MRTYTVIGFYADTRQRAAFTVRAATPDLAENAAERLSASGTFVACGVVSGTVKMVDTYPYVDQERALL